MNKQKLISVLQSRIAKGRKQIAFEWWVYSKDNLNWTDEEKKLSYLYARQEAAIQKEDKATLRQLIMDEREIKKWKKAFAEADLMIWELQQRVD